MPDIRYFLKIQLGDFSPNMPVFVILEILKLVSQTSGKPGKLLICKSNKIFKGEDLSA